MTAAIFAARADQAVTLFERNEKLGKKVYITGKGRCNITNTAEPERLMNNVVRGSRFLYSSFAAFPPESIIEWFESLGVPTVVERGGRVFPASSKASDINRALTRELNRLGVSIMLNARVESVKERLTPADSVNAADSQTNNSHKIIITLRDDREYIFDSVVVATGGLSYPATGSTGDGYGFARSFGHSVSETSPALSPLVSSCDWVRRLSGLTLKNVAVSVKAGRKVIREQGEMLFTHFGLSGPIILTLSSLIDVYPATLALDLKPALSVEQLDDRLQREFAESPRKQLSTVFRSLAPSSLAAELPVILGVQGDTLCSSVSKAERERLARSIKNLSIDVSGTRGFDDAIITRGGVKLIEIDPSTMRSKLNPNVYFAGEVIDADALTGGFNLTIAFTTGMKAGSALGR